MNLTKISLVIAVAYIVVSTVYGLMLPTEEKNFTHVVSSGETVWGIANKYYPERSKMSFDEFYCEVRNQVRGQIGTLNVKPGQVIKVTWEDRV